MDSTARRAAMTPDELRADDLAMARRPGPCHAAPHRWHRCSGDPRARLAHHDGVRATSSALAVRWCSEAVREAVAVGTHVVDA